MDNEIIYDPGVNWLERLRRGHKVWLVKEQQIAEIEFPYEPPEPGYKTGRIGIRRINRYMGLQSWFIGCNGEGIDGSLLMQPIKGNLPSDPKPLPDTTERRILRAIEGLDQRIDALEMKMYVDADN
jgi:hypothetical protein